MKVQIVSSLYRWGNVGSERCSHLKLCERAGREPEIQPIENREGPDSNIVTCASVNRLLPSHDASADH